MLTRLLVVFVKGLHRRDLPLGRGSTWVNLDAAALANHPRVNKFGNRFRVRCADAAATPRRLGGITSRKCVQMGFTTDRRRYAKLFGSRFKTADPIQFPLSHGDCVK